MTSKLILSPVPSGLSSNAIISLDVSSAARQAIGAGSDNLPNVQVVPAQCPTSASGDGQVVDQNAGGQTGTQPGNTVVQQNTQQQDPNGRSGVQQTGNQQTGNQQSTSGLQPGQNCVPWSQGTDINGQTINCGGNGIYYSGNGQPTPPNLLPGGTRRRFAKRRIQLPGSSA